LDKLSSLLFSEELRQEFLTCSMSKIEAKYNYEEVKDIDLKDQSNKASNDIDEIRKNCWAELLASHGAFFEEKGIEVVFPE